MAHLDPTNPFQAWVLSPEEYLHAQVLTSLQKQYLQNERAVLANKRIALRYDPEHPQKFLQADAELQGQIGILSYLLEMSHSAETMLNNGRPTSIVISNPSQEN